MANLPPMPPGLPIPPQIPPGPAPGSPIAGGLPPGMAPGGLPLPPGATIPGGPGPMPGAPGALPAETEAALMAQMAGGAPPPLPLPPDVQGGQVSGGGERYVVEEQEDGSLVIFENMHEGGRVAKKIVTMCNKAAQASANV